MNKPALNKLAAVTAKAAFAALALFMRLDGLCYVIIMTKRREASAGASKVE
ncbi:hypothetical protein SD77_2323 [Bacillus badius]|uniref:Uncharacterized protein n=1 Tax=Bacillus badius TaxID=1455 RepID=A0ABR5AYW0_BACBA|nr:hypothetical protein SD78_2213 [Bacillus badius]KIL79869.1 hypothetical protein SD77_2323 [Bacillus badius]